MAIGHFEDLGMRDSYPGFSDQLRAAVSTRFQGTRVSLVERSQVKPLLDELGMSLAALTEGAARAPVAQPAFLLVDGLYQFFRDQQNKINLVLRLETIGHRVRAVSVN